MPHVSKNIAAASISSAAPSTCSMPRHHSKLERMAATAPPLHAVLAPSLSNVQLPATSCTVAAICLSIEAHIHMNPSNSSKITVSPCEVMNASSIMSKRMPLGAPSRKKDSSWFRVHKQIAATAPQSPGTGALPRRVHVPARLPQSVQKTQAKHGGE